MAGFNYFQSLQNPGKKSQGDNCQTAFQENKVATKKLFRCPKSPLHIRGYCMNREFFRVSSEKLR